VNFSEKNIDAINKKLIPIIYLDVMAYIG